MTLAWEQHTDSDVALFTGAWIEIIEGEYSFETILSRALYGRVD